MIPLIFFTKIFYFYRPNIAMPASLCWYLSKYILSYSFLFILSIPGNSGKSNWMDFLINSESLYLLKDKFDALHVLWFLIYYFVFIYYSFAYVSLFSFLVFSSTGQNFAPPFPSTHLEIMYSASSSFFFFYFWPLQFLTFIHIFMFS